MVTNNELYTAFNEDMHDGIDWDLLLTFGDAENKPTGKSWLIRFTDGSSRKLTFKQLWHHVAYASWHNGQFVGGYTVADAIHVPTGTSFRM